MKRLSIFFMASLLMLGLAQCKKENTNQNNDEGNRMSIVLRIDQGNSKVHITDNNTIAPVGYDVGDIVLVSSGQRYLGSLTCQDGQTTFAGTINVSYAVVGEPLRFIFVGRQAVTLPAEGGTTAFTFSLANQSAAPAVISTAKSNELFTESGSAYTAYLRNQCALVKFAVDASVPEITLSGLTNRLRVNWDGSVTSIGTGDIITHGTGTKRYAVVAKDQAAITDGTATADGYIGTYSLSGIATNAYITGSMELSEEDCGCVSSYVPRAFSVGNGVTVEFSPGNLQYNAAQGTHAVATGGTAAGTWRFANCQREYVGNDYYGNVYEGDVKSNNDKISSSYNGWIDLFGWGTSGWNNGNLCYQPYSSSNSYSGNYVMGRGYGYGPTNGTSYLFDLTGTYAYADWGVYNAIYNPITGLTDAPGTWRTLTKDEWNYVISGRSTASGHFFAKALVEEVKGLILLPDDWTDATYTLNDMNVLEAPYNSNRISASNWATLEAKGAVFLPSAGERWGTTSNGLNSYGNYWSSSCPSASQGYYLYPADNKLEVTQYARYRGMAVRLVRNR